MENNKEEIKEHLLKDIQSINWDISYHEKKLSECKIKMQITEYALKQLIKEDYER
jgi:hypothetical protein